MSKNLVYIFVFMCATAFAQSFSDNNWITTGSFPGTDGPISTSAEDSNGNLYVLGNFSSAFN
ncbi:MAG: hypothetical protein ACXWBP_03895, partial [Limisphaerales bacterium]